MIHIDWFVASPNLPCVLAYFDVMLGRAECSLLDGEGSL
jgi:hypothetical protein